MSLVSVRLQPGNRFLLISYFLLSAVPFVPIVWGRSIAQPWNFLVVEYTLWLMVWAVFKRAEFLHWLLIPAFVALPVELYLNIFFRQRISAHHLGIIVESSPRESLEFLGGAIWPAIAVFVLCAIWWWRCWLAARKSGNLDWTHRSRWWVLALLVVGLGVWAYGGIAGVRAQADSATVHAVEVSSNPASLDVQAIGRTWPFGLYVRAYDFWSERHRLGTLSAASRAFKFGAAQFAQRNEAQVYVLVIGESSRFDRWSINGYTRETNPLLKNEANMVSLSDTIAAVSATRLSVPVILTRKPATESLKDGFSEKSIVAAFKEAGFKTFWFSNQLTFSEYDTPVSVFANEADVTQFLNPGGFTNKSNFDQILLPSLASALKDGAPKKLIVLHTLGSHWNYSQRHPANFDQWKPSLLGLEGTMVSDIKMKTELNNSYDNSVLYTDWFLAQVISALKTSKQMAAMFYLSDHGETLFDNSCKFAFHGNNTQYEFHVPAIVWYSAEYETVHPGKIVELRHNRNAKISTENIFHSFLDMADVRYSDERLNRSIFDRQFTPQTRYVDSHGWADYDNANMQGDCREVMDKGTPLAQAK